MKVKDVHDDDGRKLGEIRAVMAAVSWTETEMRLPLVFVPEPDVAEELRQQ